MHHVTVHARVYQRTPDSTCPAQQPTSNAEPAPARQLTYCLTAHVSISPLRQSAHACRLQHAPESNVHQLTPGDLPRLIILPHGRPINQHMHRRTISLDTVHQSTSCPSAHAWPSSPCAWPIHVYKSKNANHQRGPSANTGYQPISPVTHA
jgi:hypothetical protein